MGFITTRDRKTGREVFACEAGFTGCRVTGCRAVKCPFNWCQRYYVCPSCLPAFKVKHKEHHQKGSPCDISHREYEAKKKKEEDMLEQGAFLRAWATTDGGVVRVGFRNKDGEEQEYLMSHDTYDSFPLGEPVSLSDFELQGHVTGPVEPQTAS